MILVLSGQDSYNIRTRIGPGAILGNKGKGLEYMDEQELYDLAPSKAEVKDAYDVLEDMCKNFKAWFPFEPGDDKDQMAERFAITRLNLELGEYNFEDLEYLKWLRTQASTVKKYGDAIGVFVRALSSEFGVESW